MLIRRQAPVESVQAQPRRVVSRRKSFVLPPLFLFLLAALAYINSGSRTALPPASVESSGGDRSVQAASDVVATDSDERDGASRCRGGAEAEGSEHPRTIPRIDRDAPSLDDITQALTDERGALSNFDATTLAAHARLYELTYAFVAAFRRRGVPVVLGFGSHLGARRHHGVIPFGEKDVDLQVFSRDVGWVRSVIEATLRSNDAWSGLRMSGTDFGFQLGKSERKKNGLGHYVDFWLFDDEYEGDKVRCTGRRGAWRENATRYSKKPWQTGCEAWYEKYHRHAPPVFDRGAFFPVAHRVFGSHRVPIPRTSAELETFQYMGNKEHWNTTCGSHRNWKSKLNKIVGFPKDLRACQRLYGEHPFVFGVGECAEELRQGGTVLHRSTLD